MIERSHKHRLKYGRKILFANFISMHSKAEIKQISIRIKIQLFLYSTHQSLHDWNISKVGSGLQLCFILALTTT